MNVIYFLRIICKKKTSVYILKPFQEIVQSFEESIRIQSIIFVLFRFKLDDEEGAAEVGDYKSTTKVPKPYQSSKYPNVKFWDLPGIGCLKLPDIDIYCKEVKLDEYDAFLILSSIRFTNYDLQLATKVRSMDKKFFLVRTKIDESVRNSKKRKKTFDQNAMFEETRRVCCKDLGELLSKEEDIFLISNHEPDDPDLDFQRLLTAIKDEMPRYKKESFILSLNLKIGGMAEKVKVLEQRIWRAALLSGFFAAVPIPLLSFGVDVGIIIKELHHYRKALGLPEIGTKEYFSLSLTTREKIGELCVASVAQVAKLLASFGPLVVVEEYTRFIPILGGGVAGAISFGSTYYALHQCLKKAKAAALLVLKETS